MAISKGIRLRKQLKKHGYSDKTIDEILKWYLLEINPRAKKATTPQETTLD